MQIMSRLEKFLSRPLAAFCACLRRAAVLLVLLSGTAMLSRAQTPRAGRPAIRLEQVVSALDLAMLPLENAVVRLLAQNTATTPEPGLEVRAFEPWGDRGARVRMGCVAHEQCLPFYVAVDWTDAAVAQAALHAATLAPSDGGRKIQGAQALSRAGVRPTGGTHAPAAAREAGGASNVDPFANVHPGSHATLLIDGQRVHIKVPVICLENGAPGRTIRVTALDHKQTYQAQVIDGTLLKANL